MLVKAFTAAGLVAVSSAHMIMISPVPYGKSTLNNSPLDASGSDFPCKMRANTFADEGASNVFPQGSTQQLQFQGSAVHGGGSCQVSVTTDAEPNKDSQWKVIKSIEGGCPAKDTAGNLPGNSPDIKSGNKYDYTIPKEMPVGNYTLAWTWFNKVGNREMYMNCAPLTVQGSGGSEGFLQTLPDMMVANLKSVGDCSTKEGTDVQFPNAGQDVDRPNGDGSLGPPSGNCKGGGGGGKKPAPTKPGYGSGSPTSNAGAYPVPTQPAGGSPNVGSPTSNTGVYPTKPVGGIPSGGSPNSGYPNGGSPNGGSPKGGASGVPGGVFITVPKGGAAATGVRPGATGHPQSPAQPKPATPAPSSDAGPSPAGAHAPGTPCASEGDWNCVGGSSFQRCASGTWSALSQMSLGMKCGSGESADIKMAAGNAKRTIRHALRFAA
ncbi:hypothetical protein HRG_003206 [Hirsutella rhossiliensis]|uniref:Lytic polysaccharide monooxygenase n=1 Tax=Hirsutella rhossiliensis TaxID=111463 RepID=A0A9P8N1K4_9HYPO|nr:uncharacterized protein HRG_03206 [Hirsutella rhossiliensis]KAH0965190.1 hypothetical protein HRG_03206 [Hirsutella rhossiliensis]